MPSVPRLFARAVAGAAGTQLGLSLAARTRRRIGPAEVELSVRLARAGGLVVEIPPLGRARVRSHRGPLQVSALATGLDLARAEELVHGDVTTQLAQAQGQARRAGVALGLRSALAGLAGAAGVAGVGLRHPRDVAGAVAVSAAGLVTVAVTAARTLDTDAWRRPELTGLLTRAPLVLGDLRAAPARIGVYRDQLAELIATGSAVYARVTELPEPPPPDAIRLVHISDIHLNPIAFGLAQAAVAQYRAAAVLDTGDLVDWGTPAEDGLAAGIEDLGVPYVYVKGNHDSDGTAAAVARRPGATVLTADGGPVEIAGITFAGMADPRFTPDKTTGDDHGGHKIAPAARHFAERLRGRDVDVALVHSPVAARPLAGLVPLVLAGDIHRRRVERHGDTVVLVQGSTGGAGLRGVQQDPPTPVMLSVLYLDRTSRRLWGVEELTLGGLGRTRLEIVRRTAAELVAGGEA